MPGGRTEYGQSIAASYDPAGDGIPLGPRLGVTPYPEYAHFSNFEGIAGLERHYAVGRPRPSPMAAGISSVPPPGCAIAAGAATGTDHQENVSLTYEVIPRLLVGAGMNFANIDGRYSRTFARPSATRGRFDHARLLAARPPSARRRRPPAPTSRSASRIVISDHRFIPAELHVPGEPARRHRRANQDPTAEEFDSTELGVEKVIAGGRQLPIRLHDPWRPADTNSWANTTPTRRGAWWPSLKAPNRRPGPACCWPGPRWGLA